MTYGRDDHRRQHGMIMLLLAVAPLARQTAGAAALLTRKIFAAIQSDQDPSAEPLKGFHAAVLPHLLKSLLEARLEPFGGGAGSSRSRM